MLNAVAGSIGLAVQAIIFIVVYLMCAPSRGRAVALLYAALAAVDGYALVVLGAMTAGIPWQAANLAVALVVAGAFLSPRLRALATRQSVSALELVRRDWGAMVLLGIVIVFQLLVAALSPELSVDGQLYHGPTLAQLVQSGTVWGWHTPNQYLNYSDLAMVGSVNLATFTGPVWFDNAAQLPHLIILILVINAGLRGRFPRAWVRIAIALVVVTAPIIWIQPRILYVDVAYGAAVAALIVLLATQRRASGSDVLFAAIAGAAVLAIKPTGVVTSALLVLALLLVSVTRRRRAGLPWGRSIKPVLMATLVPCVLAMGFYLRNLIEYGNPVYPVQVSLGPIQLPGVIDLSVFASGDRGSGFVDPVRWVTYVGSIFEGVQHGVVKADYDPRAGGFGWMPLLVVAVVLVAVAIQIAVEMRSKRRRALTWRGNLGTSAFLVALAGVVLLVQPSTFDTRYVIGPTVVLAVAALLTTVVRTTVKLADVVAGALALILATGQAVWVEINMYPGLAVVRELRTLSQEWQPITPGNPWGRGENVSWLPDDASSCVQIVLQNEGGVGPDGMEERTALSTLPYGLYGASLCNVVIPLQLADAEAGSAPENPLLAADFLIAYTKDVARWEEIVPDAAHCWVPVQSIDSTETYPKAVTVLRTVCD